MKKFRKILLVAFLLLILCIIYIYICAIDAIPKSTILFKDESLDIKTIFGLSLENENKSVATSNILQQKDMEIGTNTVNVKLFDKFTVKEVGVSIIERTKVIPTGNIAGLKIYTSGVLVVGMSEIKGEDNQKYKPYENSGIQEGDMIIEVENTLVTDTNKLVELVNKSKGKSLDIKYMRNGENMECSISPIKTSGKQYKLGLWVRDSAAGIGTMTYYEPSSKQKGHEAHTEYGSN